MERRRGRDKFKSYKSILLIISKIFTYFPMKLRISLLHFFRNTNGMLGIGIRYSIFNSIAKNCGDNVVIHTGVYLLSPQNLSIGNNVSIHPMTYIDSSGDIDIGDDVSIAHGVTILSTTHKYKEKNKPIKNQGIIKMKTTIDNNIWIGAKSTILAGVRVSEGSIIGASSIVTKSIEKDSIAVGNPARVIKSR